jgi:casein kinase II subunit beta
MNFSSNSGDSNWIDNHLSKKGNNFLCRVDEAFIADHFNLYGLTSSSSGADFYRVIIRDLRGSKMATRNSSLCFFQTLKRILNTDDETDASSSTLQFREEAEEREAERLYGLIHARYIMTRRGMDLMQEMLMHKVFSSCPR